MTDFRTHTLNADDMGRERTIMAADRTLMAWIRTTLSMISFGFTIYKFLQALYDAGNLKMVERPQGARNLALALITLGVVSLALACVQYWHALRRLYSGRKPFTLTLAVGGFVALIGIIALMNILFHIGPF